MGERNREGVRVRKREREKGWKTENLKEAPHSMELDTGLNPMTLGS